MAGGNNNEITGTALLPVACDGEAPAWVTLPPSRAGARFDIPASHWWLTAPEAAALNLPGCPSERTLRDLISNHEVATRKRAKRGGGREFEWTSLPEIARAEYLKRFGVPVIDNASEDAKKSRPAQVALQAEARFKIVRAAEAFLADHRVTAKAGLPKFCSAYAKRCTKLEPWVYDAQPSLTPGAIRVWQRVIRTKGASGLYDKRGRPEGSGAIQNDPALRVCIMTHWTSNPSLTAKLLCRAVKAELGREVALRTMQAFIASVKVNNKEAVKALTNPDAHRSHSMVALGSRSAGIVRLNQEWQLDATRADVMCASDGRQARPVLMGLVDVTTRRAMIVVAESASGIATQALLRRAILAWGIPETIKTDNGKEFFNAAVQRFCADLDITLKFSTPFHPEQKPFVERFFGTLNGTWLPGLPGWVGRDVSQRQGIRARKTYQHRFGEDAELAKSNLLTPAALQARIDRWLTDIYHAEPHAGLLEAWGRKMSPADAALMLADQVRVIDSERQLDMLLLDAPDNGGIRTVMKKGIRVGNRWYICPEIGLHMHEAVQVRIDPADLARIIVFNRKGQFIFIAECVLALTDERQRNIAAAAHALQKNKLRVIRGDNRQGQKQFPADGLADRILGDARGPEIPLQDDAAAAMATAARPPLRIAYSQAQAALDEHKAKPQPIEPSADQVETARAYLADMTDRLPEQAAMLQCTGYTRPNFGNDDVETWLWLQRFIAEGGAPDDTDAALLAELDASPAFHQLLAGRTGTRTPQQ